MTAINQFINKFLYKPYPDHYQQQQHFQYVYASDTTSPNMMMDHHYQEHPGLVTVNNDSNVSSCSSSVSRSSLSSTSSSSSMLLSPYQTVSDSETSSSWQGSCATDYLPLSSFDQPPQSSPNDIIVYSSEDFCVSDLLDPQPQQHMLSPTFTNTTYAIQPQQQHLSPNSEYWISPMTPSMESMDGYMINMNQQQQSPCFFTKQEDDPLFMANTGTIITPPEPQTRQSLKKKTKKIHHCPHCHHTSNRANNMKEHILTHDPHRPKLFACSTCQKCFARKHDMKRHAKSHLRVPRRQKSSRH
ncbi:uncharacterized protein BX664DRAFT_336358 [Halteromyces radiatus]|uniref:uncharacterized protein n=1 Tax=Halteromyces radiatus TaxID=101107 RepID=UPI00221E74CA|nr:uncharacterized protein BX664DRAFT_336358 [Halteromyces radiatus]KAI8086626.1 hypothetical protein BX664DRAFT_336358 [Halteromyces radiatus]